MCRKWVYEAIKAHLLLSDVDILIIDSSFVGFFVVSVVVFGRGRDTEGRLGSKNIAFDN